MKNGIEFFIPKLFKPIHPGQISGNKIAAVTRKVPEIARAKVVDHGQARIRKSLLQFQDKIRTDKAGSARDNQI